VRSPVSPATPAAAATAESMEAALDTQASNTAYSAWASEPFQNTAARGKLPIEQTNVTTATSGPISGPQIFAANGCPVKTRCCQKVSGIQQRRRRR
jgi:hypothetical protein